MPAAPSDAQIRRRERATRARELLTTDPVRDIFRQAEQRALKAIRDARTPAEAWEARALLVGHDEFIGLCVLIAQDAKNVERELSAAEAQARGAAEQAQRAEAQAEYQRRADAARAEARTEPRDAV